MSPDGPRVAPFGAWSSPFTAESLVADSITFSDIQVAPDGRVLWLENRPGDGRTVLVVDGVDASPAPLSVRTRVHEYGGGAYTLAGADIYLSDFADQAIHRL